MLKKKCTIKEIQHSSDITTQNFIEKKKFFLE